MLSKRKLGMLLIAILSIAFFFQSSYIQSLFNDTSKIKATEAETILGKAKKLSDDPSFRGVSLKEHPKTIIAGEGGVTSLDGKYSFIPRWTEAVPERPNSGTKVVNNGFTELANATGFAGVTYNYTPADVAANKRASLIYTNVGLFKGKWIDMRITVNKIDPGLGFNTRFERTPGLLIGGNKNNFNEVRLTLANASAQDEVNYPAADLHYEYLDHETQAKVEVMGYNVFSDLDGYESILFDEQGLALQNLILRNDNILSYKTTDGLLHITPTIPGVDETDSLWGGNYDRELSKRSWAAYTFGPTSGYNLTFRMSATAAQVDDEALIPFETDNPNKLGYENENTDNKNNVEYSVYQYTPNNGKDYRYNSFIWVDPIHNAVKIENKDQDIKIKLVQTNKELPKSYYNINIESNNIPAVPADPENGVEAEPAGTRDVIRVEFTEQFMTDRAMYGELLGMDIKGVLNKENPTAIREIYSVAEKAFIIPNRSELLYTDTIVDGHIQKVISSNTAKAKVKTTETVQTYVSKKVTNKTAEEDSNRQPTDKAKIGDILNYEMEVKNISLVPTNTWKDVTIFDDIESYLDIDPSTIQVTQNGITTNHPEYYQPTKLSLPKQDIKAELSSDLKINFSAKINLTGSGQIIENWIHAQGFDSTLTQPVNDKAKATLAQQVEDAVPPTIFLNEKTGESDGEAKELTGTFRDKDSESVMIWYEIDGGTAVQAAPAIKNDHKDSDISYRFTIKAEDLPYGPHSISVYAIDSEGQKSNIEILILDGILQLVSSPKTLDFGTLTYDATDQKVENPVYSEPLVVLDSRADRSNGWYLSATLTKPMANAKGQELVDALRYVNKGEETTLGTAALPIYTNKEGTDGKFVVSDMWGKTEGTDGIKLKIGSTDRVYTGDYTGVITWKIMPGQP